MNLTLRKIVLFQSLSEAELEQIAPYLRLRMAEAGQIIFHQGEPGREVYFVESGQVVVFDPAVPRVPVRVFNVGGMFGELAAIDRQPRTLSARAESDCCLWAISAHDFEKFILKNKRLLVSLLRGLSASVRYTTDIFMEAASRSTHDALTGLYNRSLFESLVDVLDENRPPEVSVILIDIDGLKRVNDTQGHAAGDELIQRTANILRASFRAEDAVARIGGDEFAVILPKAGPAEGQQAVERVQAQLASYNQQHPEFPICFSIGLATGQPDCPMQHIIEQADSRMYANKQIHKMS